MKHKEILIIGACESSYSTVVSLYRKPLETLGGLVIIELSRPAEPKTLNQLIEIELMNNINPLDLPTIKKSRMVPWPKDSLLVKRRKVNTTGFRRKGINLGRR
jgi:hypothetical protein